MADDTFDNVINTGFHRDNYDNQLGAARTLTGGVIGTVVDAAASIWNSLPGTPEVETASLLKKINNDSLQVYSESPDAVNLASFVAGSLIPFGIATKGMGLARSGVKGVNWFTKAGKEADMVAVNKLFAEGRGATSEYRSLSRAMYAKGAANQALDAVAGEVAVLAMMHSHPLMEDYMEDPVKNFAISAGLGAVVGGAIGHVADRYMLRQMTGATSKEAIETAFAGFRDIAPDMTNGMKLQSHEVNIANLDNILKAGKDAGKLPTNDLAMSIAEQAQLTSKAQQAELFDSFFSDTAMKLTKEEKDVFMRDLISKPEMYGVEKVSLFTEKEVTGKGGLNGAKELLAEKPTLKKLVQNTKTGLDEIKETASVYYKEFDKFGLEGDITNYGNAASLGATEDTIFKKMGLGFNYGKVPNLDSSLEIASKTSAEIDGLYVAAKLHVDKLDEVGLKNLTIGEGDLPLLSAVVTKLRSDPKWVQNLKVKVADRNPVFEGIMSEQSKALTQSGLPVDYAQAVQKFTAPGAIDQFDPKLVPDSRGLVRQATREALQGWLQGNQSPLNKAALAWSARGFSTSGIDNTAKALFAEVYHSPGSTQLRQHFEKLADAEGNVLLYRGSKANKITQQNILESYSTDPAKAAEFGTVRLYKVHVDNIAAGWGDLASMDGLKKNEILVLPGARVPEAELTSQGKAILRQSQLEGKVLIKDKNAKELYAMDLEDLMIQGKENQIDGLLTQGLPLESISLKTNTPLDIVSAYAMTRSEGVSLSELVRDPMELITTRTGEIAKDRLKPTLAPIRLEGNIKKNPYIEAHAALDNKTMADMSKEVTALTMYGSGSETVRELGKYLHDDLKIPLDILKSELGKVNNEYAGVKFLNSTDFWARNMGSVGPIVSEVGKQVQRISNGLIKKVVSPISEAMSITSKDAVATVEFNTFVNVNASLKGWRAFTPEGTIVQRVEKVGADGKKILVLEPIKVEGKDYVVKTPAVHSLITQMQGQGKELLDLANTSRKIKGQADVTDIGLWIPSFNPTNKLIAYVHNLEDDTTKMIWANGKEEFADAVSTYKKYLADNGMSEQVKVYEKGQQVEWNTLNGRLDPITMERADISMQKTGSGTAANIKATLDVYSEIAGGYEHYITAQVRNLADLNMHEVTGMLDRMSLINQAALKNQPLSDMRKALLQPKDAAATLKNTLLGNSNLGEYAGWQKINQSFETGLSFGLNSVMSVWNSTVTPLRKSIFGKNRDLSPEVMGKIDYEQMAGELAARGIHNPWKAFDGEAAKMFGLANLADSKDTSKRVIYASNALAATVALRIGELAQPLVNILSLPILTGLATASKMPAEFMGAKLGTAKVSGVQIMYEGARAANSPLWKKFDDLWAKEGHYAPLVSETTNVLRASRSFEKGVISSVETALDSNLVKIMSKPADWSESFVRRQTMFTGAVLAKRLYPDLSDVGVSIFARDFMDKAVGNFHASQRPVFFQGTLGVALGLFQTYTLTLGQSIYRQLEMKNYKALGKAALSQSGIFGTKSLPGFNQISEAIGEHFSDENVDLTTGTYRAIGDQAADFVLYGLPSNLGPSVYTRGDVSIRPPNVLAGAQNTVAVSFVSQTMDMFAQLKKAVGNENENMGRAIGEALSMQSMSRPLARGSELLTGYSVTRKGNTVQTPEEVWTATSVFARILGTRPLEEAKLREAMHLNTFYGSKDRENRQELTIKLKTMIRGGELDQDAVEKLSEKYLRKGGTPTGWRSAYNTAIAQTEINGDITFVDKLKPDSPFNYMINNLD